MSTPSSESLYILGGTRLAAGDFDGAIAAYRAATALAAPGAALLNNLAIALIGGGRLDEARGVLQQALILQPDYTRALVNLGKVLGLQGRPIEAQLPLQRALALAPDYLPALINLGDMQAVTGDYEEAAQTLRHAIALAPQSSDAHRSLGLVLTRVGQMYDGINTLRQAVALQPASAENHTTLAQALLLDGRWQEAWPHFEQRLRRTQHPLAAKLPAEARWDGGELGDHTLWLIGEQGLGDQIQFARYAPAFRERGVRCVLACDPKLLRLLAHAGLAHETVALGAQFDAASCRWLPLMSAPGWHQTTPESVPLRAGYLRQDGARIADWQTRLGPHERLRVAFAWQGNPATETGWLAGRSPPLAALAPLFSVEDLQFVPLQKGPAAQALREIAMRGSFVDLGLFDEGPDAFLDSAAILGSVDVLVTSDSALAHLAGALGVECWLCLQAHPDWRWLRGGAQCPWYGSVRVFRQARPGDWDALYREVADALRRRSRQRLPHAARLLLEGA